MKTKTKRLISTVLVIALVFSLSAAIPLTAVSDYTIRMVFTIGQNTYSVNGVTTTMDVQPVIVEGRTMLPVRFVAEPLGAMIEWDESTEKITVRLMDTRLEFWIGQSNAIVNGNTVAIDPENPNVRPLLINDRTMLPLRFVTENLGCEVDWEEETQSVIITKNMPSASITGDDDEGDTSDTGEADDGDIDDGDIGNINDVGDTGDDSDSDVVTTPGLNILPGIVRVGEGLDTLADFVVPEISSTVVEAGRQGLISPETFAELARQNAGNTPMTLTMENKGGVKTLSDIGRGYDVFGRYATGLSLKNAVLDTDKLIAAGQIHRSEIKYSNYGEIEGQTLDEYAKSMSTSAKVSGGFMGFGASVSASFNSKYTSKATSFYKSIIYYIVEENLFINGACDYKQFVLPDVKTILDTGKSGSRTYTEKEIFDTFGTHVLVDGIFGGKLEYSAAAGSDEWASYSDFDINVKAGYNVGFASISGELNVSGSTNKSHYASHSDVKVITFGGTAQDGISLGKDKQAESALRVWRDSVPGRLALVEFGNTGATALLPIWKLCSNTARATALENAYKEYAKGKELVIPKEQYISEISFVRGWNRSTAQDKTLPGFIPINVNLNEGMAGEHVYLTYKLGTDVNYAFRDFFLEKSSVALTSSANERKSHNGTVANYYRIPMDLNAGTNLTFLPHTYIYLWASRDADKLPIREINVAAFDKANMAQWMNYPVQWSVVRWQNGGYADCNSFGDITHNGDMVLIGYK